MLEAYFEAMLDLGRRLMRLLALCLDLPPAWCAFDTRNDQPSVFPCAPVIVDQSLSSVVACLYHQLAALGHRMHQVGAAHRGMRHAGLIGPVLLESRLCVRACGALRQMRGFMPPLFTRRFLDRFQRPIVAMRPLRYGAQVSRPDQVTT